MRVKNCFIKLNFELNILEESFGKCSYNLLSVNCLQMFSSTTGKPATFSNCMKHNLIFKSSRLQGCQKEKGLNSLDNYKSCYVYNSTIFQTGCFFSQLKPVFLVLRGQLWVKYKMNGEINHIFIFWLCLKISLEVPRGGSYGVLGQELRYGEPCCIRSLPFFCQQKKALQTRRKDSH